MGLNANMQTLACYTNMLTLAHYHANCKHVNMITLTWHVRMLSERATVKVDLTMMNIDLNLRYS